MSQEYFAFLEEFCEPVVGDSTMQSSFITPETYPELAIERNCNGLCGWAKCGNSLEIDGVPERAKYCSQQCRKASYQFASSLEKPPENNPLGPINVKFTGMRPPNKIREVRYETIEGLETRIGPYRHIIDEIERWVQKTPCNEANAAILELVDRFAVSEGIDLSESTQIINLLKHIKTDDPSILTDSDEELKAAFAYGILSAATGKDFTQSFTAIANRIYNYDSFQHLFTGLLL